MKKKNVLNISLVVIFSVIVMGSGFYLLSLFQPQGNHARRATFDQSFGWKYPVAKFPSTGSPAQLAYSDIRDPGGIPQGLPVRLKIPVINVDSAIEDALITPQGRMDVPVGSVNVAWFALGPHPGQVGSAVIGGHFGINNGVPFVFYNLDKLKVGDKIYIVDDKDDTLTFVVRLISSFERNADATTVFTSHDGLAHLNLITCEGIWNQVNGTYPQRLVIFADAVPRSSSVNDMVKTAGSNFYRTLAVGSTGPDVTALQTFLEQKKFLVMPLGVSKGFFGKVTSIALGKYQTSINLPPVGIFGPQTRARVNSEFASPVIATLPTTSLTLPQPSPPPQTPMESLKSLYETPLDGLITLLLLVSIVFATFKIWRQRDT